MKYAKFQTNLIYVPNMLETFKIFSHFNNIVKLYLILSTEIEEKVHQLTSLTPNSKSQTSLPNVKSKMIVDEVSRSLHYCKDHCMYIVKGLSESTVSL